MDGPLRLKVFPRDPFIDGSARKRAAIIDIKESHQRITVFDVTFGTVMFVMADIR